jgi:hypothetical protein
MLATPVAHGLRSNCVTQDDARGHREGVDGRNKSGHDEDVCRSKEELSVTVTVISPFLALSM